MTAPGGTETAPVWGCKRVVFGDGAKGAWFHGEDVYRNDVKTEIKRKVSGDRRSTRSDVFTAPDGATFDAFGKPMLEAVKWLNDVWNKAPCPYVEEPK